MKSRTIVKQIGSVLTLAALLCGAPAAASTLDQARGDEPEAANQTGEMMDVFSSWNVSRNFILFNVIARSIEELESSADAELTEVTSDSSRPYCEDSSALQSARSEIAPMSCEDDCGDQYEDCRWDCLDDPYNFEICLDDCEEEYDTCLMFC